MQDFTGTDRFTIRRRLGAGGYGVVYDGFDRERHLPVAIKTLRRMDPDGLVRFKDEFRALADLAHPNLVTLYELMADSDQWFFTMELVEGVDFLAHVRSDAHVWQSDVSSDPAATTMTSAHPTPERLALVDTPAPPLAEIRPLSMGGLARLHTSLEQLVEGVDAIHRAGKLHRDIKPSNVLVTPAGRVVLLDFGLVTDLGAPPEQDTAAGDARIIGTPAYIAPEYVRGGLALPAGDWYAVGVMLYEALTGRRPFDGSLLDLLLIPPSSEPPPPSVLVPTVPPELDALCRRLLRRNPSERPTGAQILEQLGSRRASRAHVSAPRRSALFVGREPERAALGAAYDATLSGHAVVVKLHGGSGVGKTALVRRFLEELTERAPTAVVLAGRCYEAESMPYKAFDSVLDALARYLDRLPAEQAEALLPREISALVRLFPALGGVRTIARLPGRPIDVLDSQELRRRALVALRELFGRLTDRRPVVLIIDDMHWGDLDSAALIAELLRQPDGPPFLLVAGYRTAETGRAPMLVELDRFLRESPAIDVREVPLTHLDAASAAELANRLLTGKSGEVPGEAATRMAAEAGGNPLFIGELARHLRLLPTGQTSVEGAGLEDVIRARVLALPAEAQTLLGLIALAGRPVTPAVLARARGANTEDLRTLAVLRSERLVRGAIQGERREVEPYHDRIRVVVAGELSAAEAREGHLRLAEALSSEVDPDAERLAVHFERSGDLDRAVPWIVVAADQAAKALAFDRAAALYRQVLDKRPPADADARRSLQRRLATALANAGRGVKAADVLLEAAADAAPDERIDLTRRAAEQLLMSGHLDRGLAALQTVLASVNMRLAPTPYRALLSVLLARARLRFRGYGFRERPVSEVPPDTIRRMDACWTVCIGLGHADVVQAGAFALRHLLDALDSGEPYRIARALAHEVSQVSIGGFRSIEQTRKVRMIAETLIGRLNDPYLTGLGGTMTGVAAYMGGRWREARERLEGADVVLRGRCTGVTWELDTCHLYLSRTLWWLGELAEIGRRVPALIDEAVDRGDRLALTTLRVRVAYLVHLLSGDTERARTDCRQAIEEWGQRDFQVEHYFEMLCLTEIDLYEGDGAAAWTRVNERWPELQRSLIMRVQTARLQSIDLRARSAIAAAWRTEDGARRATLLAVAARDAQRLEREGTPYAAGFAHALRAGVAAVSGDTERAAAHLREAEMVFRDQDMRLHATAARRRLGALLGDDAGRALVADADRWLSSETVRDPARFIQTLGGWTAPPESSPADRSASPAAP